MSEVKTTERFLTRYVHCWLGRIKGFVQTDGWYIWNPEFPEDVYSTSEGKDLYFASRKDAERAVSALLEAGITTDEQIESLSDEELRRICYSALAW